MKYIIHTRPGKGSSSKYDGLLSASQTFLWSAIQSVTILPLLIKKQTKTKKKKNYVINITHQEQSLDYITAKSAQTKN